jgi:hypothetical protein
VTRYERKYRRIGRSLSRVALMRCDIDELAITERDLLDKDAGRRFLDFYGDEGIRLALERYGLLAALRSRGWDDVSIETSAHDDRHTLLIDGAGERLVELVVRKDRLSITGHPRTYDMLTVDWLALRNPHGRFTTERMRLPGQDAPGLGIGEQVMELLYRVVDRLALDGLLTIAEYFHNAVLYARELPFVDPYYEGQLRALCALLFDREELSFAQAAWAVHFGLVRGVDDGAFAWRGEAMVKSHAPSLTEHLASEEHRAIVERVAADLKLRLDRTAFDEEWRKREPELITPSPEV